MTIKKAFRLLHLWLGLLSGIVVFIVCITGAIWLFNKEITELVEGNTKGLSHPGQTIVLPPSELGKTAQNKFPDAKPSFIGYIKGKPTTLGMFSSNGYITINLNPYSGEIVKIQNDGQKFNFFNFILSGHRNLWMPREIGSPIVNYATLIFIFVIITGIFLWWPKTNKAIKNRLWFNWKKQTGIKRKMIDLHSIAGFYFSFFLITIGLTGMVWGMEWYSNGLYRITTGGKELPDWNSEKSDSTKIDSGITSLQAVDKVFYKLTKENPKAPELYIFYPDETNITSAIPAIVYPQSGVYYNRVGYYFDRYTLEEIKTEGPYTGKFKDSGFGDKLRKINYDIHVGSIGGLAGRMLAFCTALFGATLPLTGLYMWNKNRKKTKK